MNIQPGERIFAFIDGPNLHATVRALGFEIDYRKLLEFLRAQGQLIRVLYYTAIVEDQEYSTFRPLADWLDYNGYTMVTKPARGFTDSVGRRRFRTSMDVELAVDAMRLADKADHIILFSGEQSFASLASALQLMGKRVTVISTIETQPAMVADELRRQADQFVDIDTLQGRIARVGRPPRPQLDRDDRPHRDDQDDAGEQDERPAVSARRPARAEPIDRVTVNEPSLTDDVDVGTDPETAADSATVVVRSTRRRRSASPS